jgi:hypothetical protein
MLYHSNNSNSTRLYKDKLFTIVSKNPMRYILFNCDNGNDVVELTEEEIQSNPLYECLLNEDGDILKIFNENDTLRYKTEKCTDGFTYFILDPVTKMLKIGLETIIGAREKAGKTFNPRIQTVFRMPHTFNESKYHKEFDDYRSDGEWFFYAKGIKEFIDNENMKRQDALKSYELYISSQKQEEEFMKHF